MKVLLITLFFILSFSISNAQKSEHGLSHSKSIKKQSKHHKKHKKHKKRHKGHHSNSSNTFILNRQEVFA